MKNRNKSYCKIHTGNITDNITDNYIITFDKKKKEYQQICRRFFNKEFFDMSCLKPFE